MIIEAFERLFTWARGNKYRERLLQLGVVCIALLLIAGFIIGMDALKGPEQRKMEQEWASRRAVTLAEVPINTDLVHPPRRPSHILCHKKDYTPGIKLSEYWAAVVLKVSGSTRQADPKEGYIAILPNVRAEWLGCEEGEEAAIFKFNPFE